MSVLSSLDAALVLSEAVRIVVWSQSTTLITDEPTIEPLILLTAICFAASAPVSVASVPGLSAICPHGWPPRACVSRPCTASCRLLL